jgi:membrane peptidoglycan carboxypeptidase
VLDQEVARGITDILKDNAARTPAFGADSYLHFPGREVAVKTGTTNDYRDTWIIGYTPSIAVGAWAGNNDNTAMEKKVAGFIVAPMWNEFMQKYFEIKGESPAFTPPAGIDPNLHPVLRGVKGYDAGDGAHSILHYVNKDDPVGSNTPSGWSDGQYPYWEYGILAWQLGGVGGGLNGTSTETSREQFSVEIEEPRQGARVRGNDSLDITFTTTSEHSIEAVEYYLGGKLVDKRDGKKSFTVDLSDLSLDTGETTLMLVVYDETGARGGASVDITVR